MSNPEDAVRYRSLKRDDPHYTAVGRVASAWAAFELSVELAIWELADVEQSRGACMTAQIFAIPNLFKAYIALAELEGAQPKTLSKLKQMLSKKVVPINENRNRIVHDPWLQAAVSGSIAQMRATADKSLDYLFRERSIGDIDKTWRDIEALRVDFKLLVDELGAPILQERQMQRELRDRVPPPL